MGALSELQARPAPAAGEDLVPVLPALRTLIPALRPGMVVCVEGPASLGLALLAGAAQDGGWCAAVGIPELGVLAARGMGADPARLLLVDEPGPRWADVVAALTEAVRLILVCLPERPSPTLARRLVATARKNGCVLAVRGDWEGAQLRLRADTAGWDGLGDGHGHLSGRRVRVVTAGRGAAGQGRAAWMWLPGPDGRVTSAEEPPRRLEVVA
ncbi:MAG: hypothetical protein ABIS86_10490 [Streptosporangiaceae bacterium]